jgi:hypothetical protein
MSDQLLELVILDRDRRAARVKVLERAFRHYHVAKYDDQLLLSVCKKCGLDLRDAVHIRTITKTKDHS